MNQRQEINSDPAPEGRHLNVLVVHGEDPQETPLMAGLVRRRGFRVTWVRDLQGACRALVAARPDIVITEAVLADGSGLELITTPVAGEGRWLTVVLTAPGDVRHAVAAMRGGALDVVESGGSAARLDEVLDRARERLRAVAAPPPAGDPILGQGPRIRQLRERVRAIAAVPTDVMVIGETGTGKDLVARQLHALSGRRGALVALNCGAIPDTLFESELFGHEAGAFTGASRRQPGRIEQADHGTLFLDEIESMPMNQQVKLLRVLETRRVASVGGHGERDIDLRVVAAAQKPLAERCRQGLFRLDLWHRLNVVCLALPPLRERPEDIEPLFRHFALQACERFGVKASALGPVDPGRLLAHAWPGNVRELKHAAERFVLGLPLLSEEQEEARGPSEGLEGHLGRIERELIRSALARHDGRQAEAAAELGISQKTLVRRIAEYRIGVGRRMPRPRQHDAVHEAPR